MKKVAAALLMMMLLPTLTLANVDYDSYSLKEMQKVKIFRGVEGFPEDLTYGDVLNRKMMIKRYSKEDIAGLNAACDALNKKNGFPNLDAENLKVTQHKACITINKINIIMQNQHKR